MVAMRRCATFVLCTVASLLPVWGQNFVTGPNTGAESRLDNSPRNVTFFLTVTGAGTYSLAGGIFFMKDGPNTTGNVTLTVFNSALTPLGSVSLSNAQFCAANPDCQMYANHTFAFASAVALSAGSYTLVLSTNASPQEDTSYFVKGGGTMFTVAANPPLIPDLAISKSASPVSFTAGSSATYIIQVSNVGNAPSSGLITVTDTLDANLTFVSATPLPGGTCSVAGQVVTCTTTASIAAGASVFIPITVNVPANAPATVTNNVTVAGGGDTNPANNSFVLPSSVSAPDLTISKTANPVAFTQGQSGAYTITANNIGNAPSSGTVTVTDTLDPSLTFVSATGSSWSCSAAGQVVTCTTSVVIAAGASASPITINVNVGANAPTSVTNNVVVAGGGGTRQPPGVLG